MRVLQLKQAIRKLGSDLQKLKGHFLLASVHLPFGSEEIRSAPTERLARRRKEVFNQIDLCVTAPPPEEVPGEPQDSQSAARSSLGESCGIEISDMIFKKEVQLALRAKLGVGALPLQFSDTNGVDIFTVILPDDANVSKVKGLLLFTESPTADYLKKDEPRSSENQKGLVTRRDAPRTSAAEEKAGLVQGKTIREWEAEQDQFAEQPKLPAGWLRVKSRKDGSVYFWHKESQKATFEVPLPEGWMKQTSKSTGKVYYWNQKRKISVFERPTE